MFEALIIDWRFCTFQCIEMPSSVLVFKGQSFYGGAEIGEPNSQRYTCMLTKIICFFQGNHLVGAKIDIVETLIQQVERRIRASEEKETSFGQFTGHWQDFTDNAQPFHSRDRRSRLGNRRPAQSFAGKDGFESDGTRRTD
jgi:hypothetical protein